MTASDPLPQTARRPARAARLAATWALLAGTSLAHTPHDIVDALEMSPAFAQDGTVFGVFKLSEHTVFGRTTNGGRSWDEYGLALVQHTVTGFRFSPEFLTDGTAFASTAGAGIWRTLDGGDTWTSCNVGLGDLDVRDLAVSPDFGVTGRLLAATADGCFLSVDGGDTWSLVNTGLAETSLTQVAFAGPTGNIAFVGGTIVHRSTNGGLSWQPRAVVAQPLRALEPSPHFATDLRVAAIVGDLGVYVSSTGGGNFMPSVADLVDTDLNDLEYADDGTLLASSRSAGVWVSPGPFQPWTLHVAGLEVKTPQTDNHWLHIEISSTFATDGVAFVGAFEGVFRSDDRGQNWRQSDIYHQHINRALALSPAYAVDRTLLLGNYGGGLFISPDDGQTWEPLLGSSLPGTMASGHAGGAPTGGPAGLVHEAPAGANLPFPAIAWTARADGVTSTFTGPMAVSPAFATDDTLFYGHVGLWRSENRGRTWTKLPVPSSVITVRGVGVSPDYANDRTVLIGSAETGIFRSLDAGDSWHATTGVPGTFRSREFAFSPNFASDGTVFCASRNQGVARSVDYGATWQLATAGLTSSVMRMIAISPDFAADGTVFMGSQGGGVQRTVDGGLTWHAANAGIVDAEGIDIEGIAVSPAFAADGTVFCASQRSGIYRSTDGGDTWVPIGAGLPLSMPRVMAISHDFAHDGTLVLSTHDWIWRSTDAGDTWQRLPGYVRVPDGHPQVIYEQNWPRAAIPENHAGGVAFNSQPNHAFSYEFFGDSITWYANRGPGWGQAEIALDGRVVGLVDLYAPRPLIQQPVFQRTFAAPGWRTLRIRATGGQNASSTGNAINTDGFAYTF